MNNLIDDLNKTTGVAEINLKMLLDAIVTVSSHAVAESIHDNEDYAVIDIGIGSLSIKRNSEGIQYKFIPSTRFERSIARTFKTGESELMKKLDDKLGIKISNAYKELF